MSDAAYQVLVYAARYWFAALAVFIVWRAALATFREVRIVRDIRRRIAGVSTFAELVLLEDESGKLTAGKRYPFAHEAVLGSSPGCDLHIRHRDVSRRALRLTAEDDCVRLKPSRKTAALLDGEEIRGETLAFGGSELRIGALRFRIRTKEAFDEGL